MQGVSLGGRRRKSVGALSNVDRCQTACCLRPRPRLVRYEVDEDGRGYGLQAVD